ncbi:SPOR domain-containing protein [Sulfurimonas sp.]|uniref:SPOR domain-containing protein n=1 Tax=Sulfurimonas sp. TaxID=2022749 RepID=UPI0025E42925|nr:SPOR domain-containing protein [Sulfurimonas sp.]MDD5156731.1 SPOR domain-containing protein [Sulfurimonas sp.]
MEEKSELNDIILNKNTSSTNNKKIVLAVATLGIILIVVVMLMNTITSKGTDNLPQAILPPAPEIKKPKVAENEPLFEEVPVIQDGTQNGDSLEKIAQKLKEESSKEVMQDVVPQEIVSPDSVEAVPSSVIIKKEKTKESMPAHEIVKKEKTKEILTPKEVVKKERVKEIKAPKEVVKKEKVKETIKKKEVEESVKAEPSKIVIKPSQELKSNSNEIYYIQVGSFTKNEPNKNLLESIGKLGYKYKFHKVKNDSTELSKVLVGPFGSDKEAREALKAVRSSVEPGAFLTKIQ